MLAHSSQFVGLGQVSAFSYLDLHFRIYKMGMPEQGYLEEPVPSCSRVMSQTPSALGRGLWGKTVYP